MAEQKDYHLDEDAIIAQARENLKRNKEYSKLYEQWKRLDPRRDFVKIGLLQAKIRRIEQQEFDRLEQMAIDNRKSVEGINDVLKANDPAAYDHWQELLAGMSFLFDMIDFSIADINELLDRNGVGVKLEKFKEIEAARKMCDEMSLKDFTRMHEAQQQLWMDESDRLWEHLKERCGVYRRKVDKWEAKHPANP